METRTATLTRLFAGQPAFRLRQAEAALFRSDWHDWEDVTVFSKEWRQKLADQIVWCSLSQIALLESVKHDTFKAILETTDGKRIETVLMRNARGFWSICVSSQVGCAMACTFCATGTMGFTRNLSADEIIDQFRYWMYFLALGCYSDWLVGHIELPTHHPMYD
jgi:adenine C2-methylase RlmN of 23S rRNA A2503 and tRNA A37